MPFAGTPQERALLVLLGALQGRDIAWALTGSMAFALQGVPVGPHDIDIQTDEAGAYAIQSLFPDRELPVVLEACPDLAVTVDTRWTVAEQSWDLMLSLAPRVNNIHVQTFLDVEQAAGGAGHVSLGRTPAGELDLPAVLSTFLSGGFRGTVTLEPNNVPQPGEIHLRNALVMLRKLTMPTPGQP